MSSTSPGSGSNELGLDLDLHFLPAWAQQPAENKYAKYEGTDLDRPHGDDRRERRRNRPPRRDEGRGPGQPPRRDRSPGAPGAREFNRSRPQDRGRRPERAEPPAPPIEVNLSFIPEEKGVESLARQIRLTGRAYPLFDIAFLILKKPERYNVRFNVIKKPDGQVAQPLFACALDDTLWLSEQEAVDYVLNKHFATFYEAERSPTDPPKGTYTFVAQCGISGAILGPPNYHDYQNKLRKLHAERFSRMPFEVFKSRIKIVRDEGIVKKWIEDQSWKTEYIGLNVPETIKLANREEVEKHFRQTHLTNVIKPVEAHSLNGPAAQALPAVPLQRLLRRAWDEQMRFPLKTVTVLSQQFAAHGLQFFKVNKTVTHVAVARPRYLDLELTPVSDGVRKIVEFIQITPNCTRRKIVEALAPAPAEPAQPAQPPAEGAEDAEPAPEPPPTPEMAAVTSDLHWLIHQGHVIEFAKGLIELAKKPVPRPPKPERAPAAAEPQTTPEAQSVPENQTAPAESPTATEESRPAEAAPELSVSPASPAEKSDTAPAAAEVPEAEPAEPSAPRDQNVAEESSGIPSAPAGPSGDPTASADASPERPEAVEQAPEQREPTTTPAASAVS